MVFLHGRLVISQLAMEALLQYHEADQHDVLLAEEMERVLVVEMAALEVLAAEVVLTMEHSMQEVQTAEMDKVVHRQIRI